MMMLAVFLYGCAVSLCILVLILDEHQSKPKTSAQIIPFRPKRQRLG